MDAYSSAVSTPLRTLVAALALTLGAGCVTAEQAFTEGRLEDLCNGVVPVCNVQASCVLDAKKFVRSSFPGGRRLLVRTDEEGKQLVVRIFFTEMIYPGTELLVQAHSPECAGFDSELLIDVDIFDLAGDDLTLIFELEVPEKGDHLLEVFSDMSAGYLLTVDVE